MRTAKCDSTLLRFSTNRPDNYNQGRTRLSRHLSNSSRYCPFVVILPYPQTIPSPPLQIHSYLEARGVEFHISVVSISENEFIVVFPFIMEILPKVVYLAQDPFLQTSSSTHNLKTPRFFVPFRYSVSQSPCRKPGSSKFGCSRGPFSSSLVEGDVCFLARL
jgi:hypothetical protein